jgi:hypothetical protein
MSMDVYVFIDHPSPLTTIEWQQALDATHLPIQLRQDIDLSKHSGFLPITLKGKNTGFYFGLEDAVELSAAYPSIGAAHVQSTAVYTLSFGGDLLECASVYYSATALVAKFNGHAFDPQQDKFLSYSELRSTGDQCAAMAGKE